MVHDYENIPNRHFSENIKLVSWQLAECYRQNNCDYQGSNSEFPIEVWKYQSFLYRAQNICTNKQLRNKYNAFII